MQLLLLEYKEEDHFDKIRSIEIEWEVWFSAKDIAILLWYAQRKEAIKRNCRLRGIKTNKINNEKVMLINEWNVYRLITKSQKKGAEKFEEWLFDEVLPSIRKKWYYGSINRSQISNFIIRYQENLQKIPHTYFSVISELFVTLYAELEKVWYNIPNKANSWKEIRPDVSVWRMFSSFLKKNHPEYLNSAKKYLHTFSDWKEFECNMYPLRSFSNF
jgi:hypothetical protein